MIRLARRSTAGALLVAAMIVVVGVTGVGTAGAQVTADEVDAAIEKGLAHLRSQRQADGTWPAYAKYVGGNDVMAITALVYGGDNLNDPAMEQSIKALLELKLDQTYTLGFRIIALAELFRGEKDDKRRSALRQAMARDANALCALQIDNGAWYYDSNGALNRWDFSNTQIAVLGLQQAASCGVEIRPDVLLKVQKLYLEKQRDDGGWNYGRPGSWENAESYGSMTAAAVASLFLTRDMLYPGRGCPCRNGKSSGFSDPKLDEAIEKGVEWLASNFQARLNPKKTTGLTPYWLYAAERVGIATGYKYFGEHDWYAEGAKVLISNQGQDGSFGRNIPDTAFGLLFLIKGRGPILMNKLKFAGEWNRHPHDASNLAEHVGKMKEQRINWQVITLKVPVEEMHDAPVLYISAETVPGFSDEEKKKLRQFTDTGGTLLVEASCGDRQVDLWVKQLCKDLWPEWELSLIPREHAVWTADVKIMGRFPPLFGLNDGLRTFLFYSSRDISCIWNTMAIARDKAVFDFGSNLYIYSTDRGKLRAKLAKRESGAGSKYASQQLAKGPAGTVTIAPVKHGGDWYLGQNYRPWEVLGEELKAKAGLAVAKAEAVAPGDAVPAGVTALYISGRTNCDLGNGGAAWLKAYVDGGGFVLAEAVMGDARFDEPLKTALGAAGLKVRALPSTSPVISGQMSGGAKGYDASKVGYTFALLKDRIGQPLPLVGGIYVGDTDTLVGIYSPFDVFFKQTGCDAWDCRGYDAADARALASNIMLFLSSRGASGPETAATEAK